MSVFFCFFFQPPPPIPPLTNPTPVIEKRLPYSLLLPRSHAGPGGEEVRLEWWVPDALRVFGSIQGYLGHMRPPTPLGQPWGPRHRPTVGSEKLVFPCERGTPVGTGEAHVQTPLLTEPCRLGQPEPNPGSIRHQPLHIDMR